MDTVSPEHVMSYQPQYACGQMVSGVSLIFSPLSGWKGGNIHSSKIIIFFDIFNCKNERNNHNLSRYDEECGQRPVSGQK
jgi:hypothetical protein